MLLIFQDLTLKVPISHALTHVRQLLKEDIRLAKQLERVRRGMVVIQ